MKLFGTDPRTTGRGDAVL